MSWICMLFVLVQIWQVVAIHAAIGWLLSEQIWQLWQLPSHFDRMHLPKRLSARGNSQKEDPPPKEPPIAPGGC